MAVPHEIYHMRLAYVYFELSYIPISVVYCPASSVRLVGARER